MPPVDDFLKEEGCYAVIRVERGFLVAHAAGHYLVVTLSFKAPELEVVSKSLWLPGGETGRRMYALWRGYRRDSAELRAAGDVVTKEIHSFIKTETRTFMPDEGPRRGSLSMALNRLGIGGLPSAASVFFLDDFPAVSFRKHVDEDGTVRWLKVFAFGGSKGGSPVWWVTMAASWECNRRMRETRHEFAVVDPFRISDTRYEQLLMVLAEFSDVLKTEIERKHTQLAEGRAEREARARRAGPTVSAAGPVEGALPSAEPLVDADATCPGEEDRRASALFTIVLSGLVGTILGAAATLLLLRRRASQAARRRASP